MPKKTQSTRNRRIIVGDTSALISLQVGGVLNKSLLIFDYFISPTIFDELNDMVQFKDTHGKAAKVILKMISNNQIKIEPIKNERKFKKIVEGFTYINRGEGEALILAQEKSINIMITDDFKSLRDLKSVAGRVEIHLSVYVLASLVIGKQISKPESKKALEKIARKRTWENAAIYRLAKQYIDDL